MKRVHKQYKQEKLKECKSIAKANDGVLLSTKFESDDQNLTWKCSFRHVWKASYSSVKGTKNKKGSWCSRCSQAEKSKKFKDLTELQAIAEARGGKLLSKEKYLNDRQKMQWQCKEGHKWYASYNSIRCGSWCKICSSKNAGQKGYNADFAKRLAEQHGGECLSEYVNTLLALTWQCKKGHRWTANIRTAERLWCSTCKNEKIINHKFNKIKRDLQSKNYKCLTESIKTMRDLILVECPEGHISEINLYRMKRASRPCWICSNRIVSNSLGYAKSLAWSKGGQCLSKTIQESYLKYRWQCAEGHTWRATIADIKDLESGSSKNSWCPECSKQRVNT